MRELRAATKNVKIFILNGDDNVRTVISDQLGKKENEKTRYSQFGQILQQKSQSKQTLT